ncbi:TRAP transporter small permease [Sodalis ligni]|uniref:TRAP transporter small permease n=1 Tax=Sodalis ligni TaxID=2697027 RepID=UPI00193F3024|nr:TRAP transporter small permease subunit [Sodalis ligni]QWA13336.1 TRAP transporter small permease [Sodalis ligni]
MTTLHYARSSGPAWLRQLLMWAGCLLFLLTLGSTLLGIVARYFGWNGVEWTFETAEISFIWVTFIGATLAELRGENVRFTSLVTLLPVAVQRALDLFATLVLLGLSGWLLQSAIRVLDGSGRVPTPVMRLPSGIITLSLVSFSAMLMFVSLWRIWHFFRKGAAE